MMHAATHSPRRAPSDDRRDAIARAARALIVEKGVEGLRTRDIAERVGINIATLHYHVPSKEALIELVAESLQTFFRGQSIMRPRAHLGALEKMDLEFVDFREIVFEERVGSVDGLTNVEYRFRGDSLKQVDRVTVALTLPRVDGTPRGIPDGGEPTDHIVCGSEDGDFAIEYLEPATVKFRNIDGRLRVFQTWKVDPAAEDPSFAFRIKESGGGAGPVDFWGALAEMKAQKKHGEALSLAREQVKKVREAAVKERMDGEIRSLQEDERRDWAEAQAQAFHARISRRPELVDKAREVLQAFLRKWAGEGTELKAKKLLEELDKELASVTTGDADRPRRIFDRAKKCVEGGKRALAQTLLQTLVARYPSSEVTTEAQQLLKTLSE